MNTFRYLRPCFLLCSLFVGLQPCRRSQSKSDAKEQTSNKLLRNERGNTILISDRYLEDSPETPPATPTGSTTWVEYEARP